MLSTSKRKYVTRKNSLNFLPIKRTGRVQFILGTEDDDEEHIPHDLFTELDEICWREGEDAEWRETARWLKFEEDVEDGGERWSKPYVATLSLHSLFELRSCILNGTVLLDMHANTLEEIADMVLDQQVSSGQLNEDVRHRVHEALMKQHHHQNQKKLTNRIPIVRSFADIGKKQSEPNSMDKNGQVVSPQSAPACVENKNDVSRENSTVDFSKVDLHFMKKIPPGAEASNILVGELEFLDRTVVAFVRLSPAVLLQGLAEVPIPTRFLFILLGPLGKGQQYHEIGRSIATLMTDEVFHDVAYKAKDRNDLVSGIDEFLDQVTVLPPGEWDPSIRIEPPKNVPSQHLKLKNKNKTKKTSRRRRGRFLLYQMEQQRTGKLSPTEDIVDLNSSELEEYGLSYLSLRASIGLWTATLCIILVATDASSLVCYITRFTEEAFASLICIIFIYEALEKLFELSEAYPINMHNDLELLTQYSKNSITRLLPFRELFKLTNKRIDELNKKECYSYSEFRHGIMECKSLHGEYVGRACGHEHPYVPDVLFWSVILFFSTVTLSATLKQFKTSRYFPTKPTRDDRGWFVTPLGPNPWWTVIAAIIPALLCTILIFMDQQITAVIINRKEHKLKVSQPCKSHSPCSWFFMRPWVLRTKQSSNWLRHCPLMGPKFEFYPVQLRLPKCSAEGPGDYAMDLVKLLMPVGYADTRKGCGYHLDLLMVAVMLGVCSIMGLPWFVAATVLSITHVNSLKLESECSAPGEQPKFLGIREQRVTGLMIFILMGSSVFMTSILKVLALVFVRKLMDFLFTKRELSWLDDLMPESKKKKLEDAEKEEEQSMLAMEDEGTVQLPLEGHYSFHFESEQKSEVSRCAANVKGQNTQNLISLI
ncbi:sodium-driven chloride bicarbonate exchanger [Camelus ferus]|nr:sodium-driven chloride bicarbonate exchanger [Camelus ferus]